MSGTPHRGCRWGRWGLLVWLLQAFPVLALPSHGVRMTTVDGLPSNVVHQIVEDRKGYLWFATGDGLARYDGSGFRIWRMEHGLADNVVRSLALDARDQLWIGTGNGYLQRLSADRQQFARWAGPAVPTVAASPILAIQPMDDGSVWFGTRDAGLFRLDRDHFLRQHLPAAGGGGLPSARVERLVSDPHGGLWIGSAAGLARWQHDRFQTPAMLGASARPVTALGLDSQGRLHSSTAEGSRVRQLPSLQPVSGHRTPARWLGAARRGGDWFGDGDQVWWQDQHGRNHHALQLPRPHGREVSRIGQAFEDRQGRVWLSGSRQGVWRLGAQWRHFERFAAPAGPIAAAAGSLAPAADAHAWWARGGTLARLSPEQGFSPARWSYAQDPARADRHVVVEDPQGVVWVFAAPWLTRIDPLRRRRQRWQVGAASVSPGTSPQAALLACGDRVWLAGNGRVEQRAGDGSVLASAAYAAAGLRPGVAEFALQCSPGGEVWLGDGEGLKQWHVAASRFLPVPGSGRREIGALHLASDGWLWAADAEGWSAEQAAQAKALYMATLGHEVRTPLTGVLGMSELLLATPLPAGAREQVLHIQQGGRALLQVVDEALEMARLQAGKVMLHPRGFAIGPWWDEVHAAVAGGLEAGGCRLVLAPPLQPGASAVGDPDRLRQAVELLACGLAEQTGAVRLTLRIAWRPGRSGLLLDVLAEPGACPSPAPLQVREALADVDVLIGAMHGHLRVSRLPDHRWQGMLSVPLEGCQAIGPHATAPQGDALDALQVMLVEDDPLVAEVVGALLRLRGHTVVHAAHALAALTALARPGTQLMLLDLDLPGMDGLSLLRLLRQQGQRLPILVLTARRELDLELQVIAAGADGLVHKPLQGDALHTAMQRLALPRVDRAGAGNGLLCGALPDDRGGQG